MTEISAELVERCVALVRRMADANRTVAEATAIGTEARAIVAELPAPIDPDLIECREILAREAEAKGWNAHALRWRAGAWDDEDTLRSYMKVLKRGRELALSLDAESGK